MSATTLASTKINIIIRNATCRECNRNVTMQCNTEHHQTDAAATARHLTASRCALNDIMLAANMPMYANEQYCTLDNGDDENDSY